MLSDLRIGSILHGHGAGDAKSTKDLQQLSAELVKKLMH